MEESEQLKQLRQQNPVARTRLTDFMPSCSDEEKYNFIKVFLPGTIRLARVGMHSVQHFLSQGSISFTFVSRIGPVPKVFSAMLMQGINYNSITLEPSSWNALERGDRGTILLSTNQSILHKFKKEYFTVGHLVMHPTLASAFFRVRRELIQARQQHYNEDRSKCYPFAPPLVITGEQLWAHILSLSSDELMKLGLSALKDCFYMWLLGVTEDLNDPCRMGPSLLKGISLGQNSRLHASVDCKGFGAVRSKRVRKKRGKNKVK